MPVDDGSGHVDEFAVGGPGVVSQHLEGDTLVDGVAFHEDALGALRDGPSTKAPWSS